MALAGQLLRDRLMIYVTGASGYLGGRIIHFLGEDGKAVQAGQTIAHKATIIHCAWPTPKNKHEAKNWDEQVTALWSVLHVIRQRPAHIVFPSTRTGEYAYKQVKNIAEQMIADASCTSSILRFPGLFGPPRKSGLVYSVVRNVQRGRPFIPFGPQKRWVGMHVDEAASLCIAYARTRSDVAVDCANKRLENYLNWVYAQ